MAVATGQYRVHSPKTAGYTSRKQRDGLGSGKYTNGWVDGKHGSLKRTMNRGKLLILIMLTAGLTAGIVAWWHQYQQGVRVLELWDAEMAFQIRMAPECQLMRLSQPGIESNEQISIAGELWGVGDQVDIGKARGIVHARQALISDASYKWDTVPPAQPVWTEAIRFGSGPLQQTFAFDLKQGVIRNVEHGNQANLAPHVTAGLRTFLDEQWAELATPSVARPAP